ncbi:MAG: adenosylmethionine--8-amino-7-oxononanoate transaminase [bacterium]|nr:adenosylmethionine--8-amino-7-oxononanoate transaminase [bacterium]
MEQREERNKFLKEADRNIVWHPFTQMKDYKKQEPLIIEEGKGCYLKDIDGSWYLDGISSLWVNVHGHRKEEIDNALKQQIDRISHSTLLGFGNIPSIELAKKLIEIVPSGLSNVFYSDSGSTAVEIALKIAFQYWQHKNKKKKTKFVNFVNAYHGDTIGSVSVGGIDLFHKIFAPFLFNTFKVKAPYCYRCHLNLTYPACQLKCLQELEDILAKHHEEIAALIVEPTVQGAAGMLVQPEGYLKNIRILTKKYQVLLIADEVATGFGRTGKMFACEWEGVSPDVLCLAKSITAGYLPLAATITSEEIFEAFLGEYKEQKTFFHGHTYTGNPLACIAALANLEIFKREEVLERLKDKIKFLSEELENFNFLNQVGEIRQKGFMVGIELVKDKKLKIAYEWEERAGIRVCNAARKRGVILRPLGNVVVIIPPLSITKEELRSLLNMTYLSIKEELV